MKTIESGNLNEKIACEFLIEKGLTLVTSNYHSRYGEIDLIMRDAAGTWVFVEVRFRQTSRFGGAAMSVTRAKQKKIALTALTFLQRNNKTQSNCRFDVVAISPKGTEWIKSSFDFDMNNQ